MRGIVLCGGHGTRLKPLTNITNKHLIGVYDRPMIDYPISTLKQCGIQDILIVSGREHAGDFIEYLGSGKDYGLNFTYRVQEEAGGIAQALFLGRSFIGEDGQFLVILGDNIFENAPDISLQPGKLAKVFLKHVNDADRFGVAQIDENKNITSIIEKPKDIKNGYAVTGLYLYPRNVFDVISKIKPSTRGELEISEINQHYITKGCLDYEVLTGFWSDAGTHESLAKATQWAIQTKEKKLSTVTPLDKYKTGE